MYTLCIFISFFTESKMKIYVLEGSFMCNNMINVYIAQVMEFHTLAIGVHFFLYILFYNR